jgi:hypothetical protein
LSEHWDSTVGKKCEMEGVKGRFGKFQGAAVGVQKVLPYLGVVFHFCSELVDR